MNATTRLIWAGLALTLTGCIETRYDTGASGEDSRVITSGEPQFASAAPVAEGTAPQAAPPAPALYAPPPLPAPVAVAPIPEPPAVTVAAAAPAPVAPPVAAPLPAAPAPVSPAPIAPVAKAVTPAAPAVTAPRPVAPARPVAKAPPPPTPTQTPPTPPTAPEQYAEGFAALRGERYKRAERYFIDVLELSPNDPYALMAMGAIHERTGREFDATTYYVYAEQHGAGAGLGGAYALDGLNGATVAEVARGRITALRGGG